MTVSVHANWIIEYNPLLPGNNFVYVSLWIRSVKKIAFRYLDFWTKKEFYLHSACFNQYIFYRLEVRWTVRCWINFSLWYLNFYKFVIKWVNNGCSNCQLHLVFIASAFPCIYLEVMSIANIMPSLRKNPCFTTI